MLQANLLLLYYVKFFWFEETDSNSMFILWRDTTKPIFFFILWCAMDCSFLLVIPMGIKVHLKGKHAN